ncbi:LysM peptidoglycan-binding domain-containing protein [Paenibacillus sanguinis]|uniref:LysM peptidoglycan-binding domain-containing protein n=1 Tax=Paenibacillus sanguinis TaxID=225906 RepID=UPI00036BD5DD|nr:LysM peptidoglycan-binding domain-containing protein [Paenibacillus sanguinis]
MLKYSSYRSIYEQPSLRRPVVERVLHKSTWPNLRFFQMITLLVVLVVTCTGVVTALAASSDDKSIETELAQVVVMSGDTLWEIAVAHKPANQDTRIYVEKLKRANGLETSKIQAGDVLLLPTR